MNIGHTWALVLAAGEGNRLRSVTTTSTGVAVPKQFCSLHGGLSLLHEALQRAQAIAAREHICTVVAQQHRPWWETSLQSLPARNLIVQPQNRGTANGILLPLLHIMGRDPEARIVLLPADHHVRDEAVLASALQRAVGCLKTLKSQLILLGIRPEEVDPELGYIIPAGSDEYGLSAVKRFEEKPTRDSVPALIRQGALWNMFIVVARARALLNVLAMTFPRIVAEMGVAVLHDALKPREPKAAGHLYKSLPEIDFSRHVAQESEASLRVMAVPPCGWSDLGTPSRIVKVLDRLAEWDTAAHDVALPLRGHLRLSDRCKVSRAGVSSERSAVRPIALERLSCNG